MTDRWIDLTKPGSDYEHQHSFVTDKWRHRKRGEEDWKDGPAPDAAQKSKHAEG